MKTSLWQGVVRIRILFPRLGSVQMTPYTCCELLTSGFWIVTLITHKKKGCDRGHTPAEFTRHSKALAHT